MATAPPLTHHDIIALVEPFSRQGRQVDLAGSDRTARKLLFKPVERMVAGPDLPALPSSERRRAQRPPGAAAA